MQARQEADSLQALVSEAAGQAADAWAQVQAFEAKGDAAAAASAAAQAVALQQQCQEQQEVVEAAARQAADQVRHALLHFERLHGHVYQPDDRRQGTCSAVLCCDVLCCAAMCWAVLC